MISAKIHHVSINVEDLNKSKNFYMSLFNLKVLNRPQLSVDGVWLEMEDGRQIHLIQGDVPTDVGQHFALEVNNLEEACAHILNYGIKIRGPFQTGNASQIHFNDPDGNRIEVTQINTKSH